MANDRIFLIEDHHEAFDVWRKLKIKNAPLAHLDAHIDFGFYQAKPAMKAFEEAKTVDDLKKQLEALLLFEKYNKDLEKQLNIGNYIYPAMRDGIVGSFHWIIPGGKKEFTGSQKILRRMIRGIRARDPHERKGRLYNKVFFITSIYAAKRYDHLVLIDVDVDYLLFDSLKETSLTKAIGKRKPWLYPGKLVGLLKRKFPRRLCTTIAYSVNGGFTPILYKFFGDEIRLRLKRDRLGLGLEKVFSLRNKGIETCHRKDLDSALKYFKDAARALEKVMGLDGGFKTKFFAHLFLWLFNISWIKNNREEARFYYSKAIKNDPALRVADNNFGWLYMRKRKLQAARREFEKMVFCDPQDHNAIRGLGDVLYSRKDYRKARDKFGEALKLKSDDKRALAGLAESCLRLNDLAGAEESLLRLKRLDPESGIAYKVEAGLCRNAGDPKKALALYKESVMRGQGGLDMYKEIFKILKVVKDKELSRFFRSRYKLIKIGRGRRWASSI